MKFNKWLCSTSLLIGVLLTSGATAQSADIQADNNKKVVLAFYEAALIQLDSEKALSYIGTKYIQHNPIAPDGTEGLKGLINFLKQKYPERKSSIKRVIAQGDLVVLHVHSKNTPEDRGNAIMDIFRLEGGKIVEHWDVIQAVPEKAANTNSMF